MGFFWSSFRFEILKLPPLVARLEGPLKALPFTENKDDNEGGNRMALGTDKRRASPWPLVLFFVFPVPFID